MRATSTPVRLRRPATSWSKRWTTYDRIVMFGPSHYVWFTGLALPEAELLETPLGTVAVDADAAARLAGNPLVTKSTEAHEREHSLEVQLPFLQVVAPGIPVVPLLTGDVHPVGAADAVESILDDETLLLVSSDLSHYHDSATARRLDAETAASIERLDPGALTRESACGRTGVQAALHLARRSGYRVQLLDLRNSSDTAGPPDRVVGYGTFAIGELGPVGETDRLTAGTPRSGLASRIRRGTRSRTRHTALRRRDPNVRVGTNLVRSARRRSCGNTSSALRRRARCRCRRSARRSPSRSCGHGRGSTAMSGADPAS